MEHQKSAYTLQLFHAIGLSDLSVSKAAQEAALR